MGRDLKYNSVVQRLPRMPTFWTSLIPGALGSKTTKVVWEPNKMYQMHAAELLEMEGEAWWEMPQGKEGDKEGKCWARSHSDCDREGPGCQEPRWSWRLCWGAENSLHLPGRYHLPHRGREFPRTSPWGRTAGELVKRLERTVRRPQETSEFKFRKSTTNLKRRRRDLCVGHSPLFTVKIETWTRLPNVASLLPYFSFPFMQISGSFKDIKYWFDWALISRNP